MELLQIKLKIQTELAEQYMQKYAESEHARIVLKNKLQMFEQNPGKDLKLYEGPKDTDSDIEELRNIISEQKIKIEQQVDEIEKILNNRAVIQTENVELNETVADLKKQLETPKTSMFEFLMKDINPAKFNRSRVLLNSMSFTSPWLEFFRKLYKPSTNYSYYKDKDKNSDDFTTCHMAKILYFTALKMNYDTVGSEFNVKCKNCDKHHIAKTIYSRIMLHHNRKIATYRITANCDCGVICHGLMSDHCDYYNDVSDIEFMKQFGFPVVEE